MFGAESVLEQKQRQARNKKRAQRLSLEQDARAVSVLRARNAASQHSRQESLLPQAASIIRDCNTARERSENVFLPPQAVSIIRVHNTASQRSCRESLLPQAVAATTARHAELERFRAERLSNAEHIAFNEQNSDKQLNYRHNQGGLNVVTEDFQSHLTSFEDEDKISLQNHPFVQKQQENFHNVTSKYEMRQGIVCCERWPTNVNLHVALNIYKCIRCKRNKHQLPQFLSQNDMIPLSLSSGIVQELCSILQFILLCL